MGNDRSPFPEHTTVVDGCVVHGDKPMTPEGEKALREVIAVARKKMEEEKKTNG